MTESDLQTYVDEKIASGQFSSPEEFATEAIRVYRQIESEHETLQKEVLQRIKEAEDGSLKPLNIDAIKAKLLGELNANGTPKV